jgi:hypothetical protein
MAARIAGILLVLALVVGVIALLVAVPSRTDTTTLAVRGGLALAVGLVLVAVVRRMVIALAEPPPAAPPQVEAKVVDVVYVCPTCGTRVRLEIAATGKPPRHCGEEMEPSVSDA